jgi:adenosylhomocysteine nucleosidase
VESSAAKGRIAFICAMPIELVPLAQKLSLEETKLGDLTAHMGTLGDREVVAIVTGMGTAFAREHTERLLDAVPVERVVVVGITGALESETPIGTLIRPEVVVNSATGTEYRPAPFGEQVPHGTMWTTDVLITGADALADLRAQGVVSLDMETAAIAAVCDARGIPWSVFRVISDRANDGSVDEEVFHLSNQDGTPNRQAIASYFAKYPERLPEMARIADDVKRATESAADAAIRACTS